ncbi:MAG TPA: hypothetical protein VN843_24255, partial [Anaerolineales bacterium]|nr:hypothetical protein [Anaerolineales bacterium]
NQMFVGTATLSSVVIGTHSNGQPIKGWGIHVPDGIWTGSMNQIFNPSFKFPVSIKADFNYIGQEISEMSPVCIDKSKLVTNSFVITGTEAFPNVNAFVEVIVHDKVWSTLDWVLADRLNKIIYGPGLPKTPVPRCTTYKPLP